MEARMYAANPSNGANHLRTALGIRMIRRENSTFRGSPNRTVINWGASELPEEVAKCRILNTADAVSTCSNKLTFLQATADTCRTPRWTENREEAAEWFDSDGSVFCRTLLRASGGRGIVEAFSPDELVTAGLYTRYIPKRNEYRIHICNGEPFLTQRKARRHDYPDGMTNWHIRNHDFGFIFARNEDHIPNPDVYTQAIDAFNSIEGLTFGSVDVIYNEHRNKAYVLEINTATGMEGSTVDDYANVLRPLL